MPSKNTHLKPADAYFFVGSTNPVKINSVKSSVITHWPKAVVKGFEVPSGVSAQPMSDAETKLGARNRAKAALEAGLAELHLQGSPVLPETPVLGVGLEGGVFEAGPDPLQPLSKTSEMWSTVWCIVIDQTGHTCGSNGARFLVPEIVANEIRKGDEMGIASQKLSGIENVKHKGGLIGILTNNFTNRTEEYSAIAKMAIGMWFGRHWQDDLDIST